MTVNIRIVTICCKSFTYWHWSRLCLSRNEDVGSVQRQNKRATMLPSTPGTFLHIFFYSTQRFRAPSQLALRISQYQPPPLASWFSCKSVWNVSETSIRYRSTRTITIFNHIHAANISSNLWFITELADGRKVSHFTRLWQLGTFRDVERESWRMKS